MPGTPSRTVLVGTAAAGALLLLAAPTPAAAVRTLRDAGSASAGSDPTGPLVALVSLLAWALALWLLAVAATTAGGHLPGAAGRALATVARRTAPVAVRRSVEVALGLSVAVGVLGASPAAASPAATSLDGAAGPAAAAAAAPDLDWGAPPTAPPPTAPPAAAPPPAAPAAAVVVQPGDSLWELAEQDLRSRGTATPSDAQVARAWPAWWAANRDAVGADPHLLQPGTPLVAPDGPPSDG